jgi:hypothetical protein
MTQDEFVAKAKAVHGDRYDYSDSRFKGISKKVQIICRTHGPFETVARNHLAGRHCLKCSGKARLTTAEFIENARQVHGDRYDYTRVEYRNNSTKVEVICREHGPFMVQPNNHLQRRSGCPSCSGCKRTTREDFIARARAAHGDKYDYSKIEYVGVDTKVAIICPEHGEFEQVAFDHMKGRGCVKCGIEKSSAASRRTLDEFIRRARARHGDRFDYSRAKYINSTTLLEIVCPEHGPFWQTPTGHIESTGCPACATTARVTTEEFIRRARAVHGDRYDYSRTVIVATYRKALVACPEHGDFLTMPKDHIAKGSGCPRCAREATSSAAEQEIADWLHGLGLDVVRNDRTTLDGFEIDIFIPSKQIGIEFNGAYWHHDERLQHPRIHETKALRAASLGIGLMTVWDFDWTTRPDFVKRAILHRLGLNNGRRISARACAIQKVGHRDAAAFYDRTHIQGRAWRAIEHYALMHCGDMVACMSFSQASSRRGKTGSDEWELLRFSTDGIVRGGASRLFAAFTREHAPEAVWSFSDRQSFDGRLYGVLGFERDGNVSADYRVHHQRTGKTWHKSAWQRRHIPARLAELGIADAYDPGTDPRTEREMQAAVGAIRIMDAGKIRWKWTKNARSSRALGAARTADQALAEPA